MATQNDYSMICMNGNPMLMPDNSNTMLSDIEGNNQLENYYSMPQASSFDTFPPPPVEFEGFLILDDFEGDHINDELQPRYMDPAAIVQVQNQLKAGRPMNEAQRQQRIRRKIHPVKHPALKLQTPIAYKCDTDPAVIPIQKDGMAICEKCGAIGVKHAFYTRHRNYCSLACARGSLPPEPAIGDPSITSSTLETPPKVKVKDDELVTRQATPYVGQVTGHLQQPGPFPGWMVLPTISSVEVEVEGSNGKVGGSFDWVAGMLKNDGDEFLAAPVNLFQHAPMSDSWLNISPGIKVEVANTKDSYWVATVVRVEGYLALLRYEGFKDDSAERDFWINLASPDVHHVGWCAIRGKPLIPPKSVIENADVKDWKEFLVRQLTGARTLQSNFYTKMQESLKSRFRVGLTLEVVDREHLSQVCLATVRKVVGKRLHVMYYNADETDAGFWCHEDSPLIHPVGWAYRVGHDIDAPAGYLERCENGIMDKDDACEELFTAPFQAANGQVQAAKGFQVGTRLEAVDPLNLGAISAATIMKILNDGYLMVRIDSFDPDPLGRDWFCYHASSPCIFPPNFCRDNNLPFLPPLGYTAKSFSWKKYAQETGCVLASPDLFQKEVPAHGFLKGQHLESVDLMSPWLVCVAQISRVVGRLLRIHFDGWGDEYDQWVDCLSSDLFPVGWCQLVGHKLEGPHGDVKASHRKGRTRKKLKTTKSGKKQDQLKSVADESTPVVSQISPTKPEHSMEVEYQDSAETESSMPYIPRLSGAVDAAAGVLTPETWNSEHVAHFLNINDCGIYAQSFSQKGINGSGLLNLSQDQVMDLTEHKIGPTVKILNLIQLLKTKTAKSHIKKLL